MQLIAQRPPPSRRCKAPLQPAFAAAANGRPLWLLLVLATAAGQANTDATDLDGVRRHYCGSELTDALGRECHNDYASPIAVWGKWTV